MLDDGTIVVLQAEDIRKSITKDPIFLLYVPPPRIDDIYQTLRSQGFEESLLVNRKGERYSLVKKLSTPWELHVRIYNDGFIEGKVEVSREYLEHLGESRIYVIYETYNYYNRTYDKLHIFYKPRGRWVVRVLDHFNVKIKPPKHLTPWKPIVITTLVLTTVGLLAYALSKLEKGD